MGRRARGAKRFVTRSPDPSSVGTTIIRGTSTRPLISYTANQPPVILADVAEPLSEVTPIRFDVDPSERLNKDDGQKLLSDHDEPPSPMEDDRLYCVCKRLYDGRTMIACDRCDNWYHNDCVGIPDKSVELVDIYICPSCQTNTEKQTTWKKKCARPGCHLASRMLSKYCSDWCGIKLAATRLDNASCNHHRFWQAVRAAKQPEGIVTIEHRDLVNSSSSELNKNSDSPSDVLLDKLENQLNHLEKKKSTIETQVQFAMSRSKYLTYAISRWENMCLETARALQIQENPSSSTDQTTHAVTIPTKPKRGTARGRGRIGRGGVKKSQTNSLSSVTSSSEAPCGFDVRLIWDDKDWAQWTSSEQFAALFNDKNNIEQQPQPPQTGSNDRLVVEEGGNSPSRSEVTNVDHGIEEGVICLIMKKKCDRHLGWQKTRENDFQTEINSLNMVLDKLSSDIQQLKEEIEDRRELCNFRMAKAGA